MMTYLHHLFPLCVLRQEMLLTFFLAILYMGPLVILENLWYFGVLTKSRLDNAGFATHSSPALTWAYKLLSSFVRAYLVAGIFEEGAKFLALRRLRTLPYVTDPRALVTYGLCAGAAFGTVENLFIYAFAYGIDNTIARAFLSVPLHAMTGMLIACALAEDRFLALSSLPPSESPLPFRPWWRIVAASVLVHGSFDLIDFLFAEDYDVVSLVVEVVVVVAGFAYVRFCLLRLLMAVPIEDDLQKRIGREKQVAAAVAALAVLVAEEEEGRDLGVAGGREEWGMQGRSGGGGLEIPTMKHVLKVVGAACVCCTGMLLFLYLCPLS
jgi:RsiW-degrading membrane proteinase PrsW (M82 family)